MYGAVLDKPKGISVGGGDKKGNTKQSAPGSV